VTSEQPPPRRTVLDPNVIISAAISSAGCRSGLPTARHLSAPNLLNRPGFRAPARTVQRAWASGLSKDFIYFQVRDRRLLAIRIARQLRFRPPAVDGFNSVTGGDL
jgi:hypothetical protein